MYDPVTGLPIPEPQPAPQFVPGRPAVTPQRLNIMQVNSREQALGVKIRPNGGMYFFVDFSTGQIYMRRVDPMLNEEFYVFNAEAPSQAASPQGAQQGMAQQGMARQAGVPQDAGIMDRLARIEQAIGGLADGIQSVRNGTRARPSGPKSPAGSAGNGDGAGAAADAGGMAAG